MNFLCLDVETANESAASICQIGIARFLDDRHHPELDIQTLVNPEDYFLDELVDIHGITAESVQGAVTFPAVYKVLADVLGNNVVLCHSPFDRVSLARAAAKYGLPPLVTSWLDTLRVARRAWPERIGNGGHGLNTLAQSFGISFAHHNALEDARCCGEVFLHACRESGLSLEEWLKRAYQPITSLQPLEINPDGPLFGEVIVFTGQLCLPRREVSVRAASAGCRVDDGVTKHTTLVVVGEQDVRRLNGAEIRSKHQKARDLIAKGKPIRILTENDFDALLQSR